MRRWLAFTLVTLVGVLIAADVEPQIRPGDLKKHQVRKQILYQLWGPGTPLGKIQRQAVARSGKLKQLQLKKDSAEVARPREYSFVEGFERVEITKDILRRLQRPDALTLKNLSPRPALEFTPDVEGVDPMVAVGEEFLVVTQDHRIAFFAKSGELLEEKGGFPVRMSATAFFSAFVAPENPDGTANLDNINRYLNFPQGAPIQCDVSDPTPDFPCVEEFYDTRSMYDPFHERFVILSAARHHLWPSQEHGEFSRRFIAIAVSRTEDPRDGFHQWMPTWSNVRDWPWMGINGDFLIVAHKGKSSLDPPGPVAAVFHLPSMILGNKNPPHFEYTATDFGGNITVSPVKHYPGESFLTFMVRRGKGSVREIFAFAPPSDPWKAPALMKTSVPIRAGIGSIRDSVTFRKGRLHYASVQDLGEYNYVTYVVRIPVWQTENGIASSSDPEKGFYDRFVSLDSFPTLEHRISREVSSSAVNSRGDMLIAYGRYSSTGSPKILPEVRYAVWYHDEVFPRWSQVLKAGELHPVREGEEIPFYARLDYTAVAVDPADGLSFWIAHEYGASSMPSDFKMVVGKVTP